ncbi:3569_t:CDS:2 [Funneliformis caledonium]|uniref:3569_t:CDS:1 n=1 Tax=Funneliformis caledonium TaxID=1117310 RepID=A0A9N8VRM8_9GLOM|nr:3569_t:CDS:2 [Funneliformis caledonium]
MCGDSENLIVDTENDILALSMMSMAKFDCCKEANRRLEETNQKLESENISIRTKRDTIESLQIELMKLKINGDDL